MTLVDVVNFGGIGERQKVHSMQLDLQFDDPINIQFTSVRESIRHFYLFFKCNGKIK